MRLLSSMTFLAAGALTIVAAASQDAGGPQPIPSAPESAPVPPPAPQAPQARPTTARSEAAIRHVDAPEAAALIRAVADGKGPSALDVRTLSEYQAGHVTGSLHLVPGQGDDALREAVKGLDPHRTYLLYCVAGVRAATMAKRLADLGFTDLFVLDGGYKNLKASGLPVDEPAVEKPR